MTGAQAILHTLRDSGVDVCFANPGTTEISIVACFDEVPSLRGVLTLFEGVATGAADGFARMSGRPAATLLHMGCGLGNGLANLHNAQRARVPVVNVVGDHPSPHKSVDSYLSSDITSVAGTVSGWVRTSVSASTVGHDVAEAIAAAQGAPAQVATLIVPADVAWSEGAAPGSPEPVESPSQVLSHVVETVAAALRSGQPTALFLGGDSITFAAIETAAAIRAATGARVIAETFPRRIERGSRMPPLERLPYLPEFARGRLKDLQHCVLVGVDSPSSFFAHPDAPSGLLPPGCRVHTLAIAGQDGALALEHLSEVLGAKPPSASPTTASRLSPPQGPLDAEALARVIAAHLPDGAIVCDEGNTAGARIWDVTSASAAHDWLCLTGGAIGGSAALAIGAAMACPDRPVVSIQGDGSALYTIQSLWTQAREGLNITTLILNNRSYSILKLELARAGGGGAAARQLLDLSNPNIDFVSIARGFGVPSARVRTADELVTAFTRGVREPGPTVIDVTVRSRF